MVIRQLGGVYVNIVVAMDALYHLPVNLVFGFLWKGEIGMGQRTVKQTIAVKLYRGRVSSYLHILA